MEHWDPQKEIERTRLELLAEYSTDMIAQVSKDGIYTYVSPSAAELFSRPIDLVLGKSIYEFVYPEDRPLLYEASQPMLNGETETMKVILRAIKGDGALCWVEVCSRFIGDPSQGAARDSAVFIRNIDERKMLEDKLREQAMVDGLTGLSNRRMFDERISTTWNDAIRQQTEISLLLLDIDHFKLFNDRFGHQTGDDCLRAVAQSLLVLDLPQRACAARYGGEELAIILPDTDASTALAIAENARAAVASLALPNATNTSVPGVVTVSVGAATAIPRKGGTAEMPHALIAAADRALYQAKANGRNRVEACLLLAKPA